MRRKSAIEMLHVGRASGPRTASTAGSMGLRVGSRTRRSGADVDVRPTGWEMDGMGDGLAFLVFSEDPAQAVGDLTYGRFGFA